MYADRSPKWVGREKGKEKSSEDEVDMCSAMQTGRLQVTICFLLTFILDTDLAWWYCPFCRCLKILQSTVNVEYHTLFRHSSPPHSLSYTSPTTPWGESHIKVTGMLVVPLWGVNCRFWSHLGCLGCPDSHYLPIQVLLNRYTCTVHKEIYNKMPWPWPHRNLS